jgi:mannose-6-phosphate isomerase-like protein (cupin superfamily)
LKATRTRRDAITPYQTKDGSEIRELIHPSSHPARHQSLAEANVPPGGKTRLHRHHVTEELYHILDGQGLMTLDDETFEVTPGDSVLIPPGGAHRIENLGAVPLRILCCCAPAYSHDDTEMLDA